MVTFKIRGARITIKTNDDTLVELSSILDLMVDPEIAKELLSNQLFIDIRVINAFCDHFQGYNYNQSITTQEQYAKVEMAFTILSQLIKTDVLDNLLTKEKDSD